MSNPAAARPADSSLPTTLGRNRALDGFRGVAVLLVIVYDALLVLVPVTGGEVDFGRKTWLPGGFLGVDLFFVLSGFLITALMLAERQGGGGLRMASFYRRRALRILPPLAVLLVAYVGYVFVGDLPREVAWGSLLSIVFFVSNYFASGQLDGQGFTEGMGHLWTLSVEGQFYLVWPLVVVGLLSLRRHVVVGATALGAATLAVAVHRAILWDGGTPWESLFLRTDTRADALLVGALLAFLWVRGVTPRRGLGLVAWASAGGVAFFVLFGHADGEFFYRGGFTLIAVLAAAMILGIVENRWTMGGALEFGPLVSVGLISFGLYLWHLPVFVVVATYGEAWSPVLRVVVAVGAVVALTVASWRLIETPSHRWRQWLERPRPPAAVKPPKAPKAPKEGKAPKEAKAPVPPKKSSPKAQRKAARQAAAAASSRAVRKQVPRPAAEAPPTPAPEAPAPVPTAEFSAFEEASVPAPPAPVPAPVQPKALPPDKPEVAPGTPPPRGWWRRKSSIPLRRSGTRAKRTMPDSGPPADTRLAGLFDDVSVPGTVRKPSATPDEDDNESEV